jgi:hypothetical protein
MSKTGAWALDLQEKEQEMINPFYKSNKERADRIKEMIGEDKDHGRPADIIADIMHYCKFYPDIEDNETYHDFDHEVEIAKRYYEEEIKKEEA